MGVRCRVALLLGSVHATSLQLCWWPDRHLRVWLVTARQIRVHRDDRLRGVWPRGRGGRWTTHIGAGRSWRTTGAAEQAPDGQWMVWGDGTGVAASE